MDPRTIERAATGQVTVVISYTDNKGAVTVREVEPYEIKQNKLFAWDVVRSGIRAFRLDRIQTIEPTNSRFEPRFPINLAVVTDIGN